MSGLRLQPPEQPVLPHSDPERQGGRRGRDGGPLGLGGEVSVCGQGR